MTTKPAKKKIIEKQTSKSFSSGFSEVISFFKQHGYSNVIVRQSDCLHHAKQDNQCYNSQIIKIIRKRNGCKKTKQNKIKPSSNL